MSFVKISPGVCGCGFMGKNHIRNYLKQDNIDFVYVYDVNPEIFKTDDYLKSIEKHLTVVESLGELKDSANVISICSPSEYHYDNLVELYDKANFYLVEKPLFLEGCQYANFKKDYPQCYNNIKCGYVERYNSVINELIKSLDEVPIYIEFKRFNPSSKRLVGEIEYDLTIHDLDLLNYITYNLCRKFEDVCYDISMLESRCKYENNVVYLIECWLGGDRYLANISTSRNSMKKVRQIYIETETKTYTANLLTREIEIISKKENDVYKHDGDIYTEEYETIIKNVNGEEPLYLELKNTIRLAKIYFGIIRNPTIDICIPMADDFSVSVFYHEMLGGYCEIE